ncbi:MAG: 3-hydroxybutyryl-CoA dehydrogenase, partial [Pseudonocardiales bacterium]|nr:3-hydroxybutyryl-CoA dehydrogenase [Pseudonocardiales bacterium]
MAREINTVGVVGFGTMGAGIVEVLARTGLSVKVVEVDAAGVERGLGHLEHSTLRAVKREKLTEDEKSALHDRITTSLDLTTLQDCDLVIEAVPESVELKTKIFKQLDEILQP